MAFRDLRGFCALLEARNALKRIPTPVSLDGEVAEIADRVARRGGPALLFERVEGYSGALAMNAFATPERVAWAFGADELRDLDRRAGALVELTREGLGGGLGGRLKALGELAQIGRLGPRRVDRAPCQEVVVTAPSFGALPLPRPIRGGPRRLALLVVMTRDDDGRTRLGGGTLEVIDERRASIHGDDFDDGDDGMARAEPAAIAIGGDPATIWAAAAGLPPEADAARIAAVLRRGPIDLVPARTVPVDVPATAEIVLEGTLERPPRTNGGAPSAVFTLTAITHRRDAMMLAALDGEPVPDVRWLARATERIFLPLLRLAAPEIVDLNAPAEGGLRNIVLVSIRNERPGQPHKVIAALFGIVPTCFARAIVVFDDDVDVQDPAACAARAAREVDWRRDMTILDGPLARIGDEPARPRLGTKIGIDATRSRGRRTDVAPRSADADEVMALVDRKWASYGIGL